MLNRKWHLIERGYKIRITRHLFLSRLKEVAVDNWALFYTFSSLVSEKPRARNDLFFFLVPKKTFEEVASNIQVIRYFILRSKNEFQ